MVDLLNVIQTLVIVSSAVFGWLTIRKYRDSRHIDFVIDAEVAIDQTRLSLVGAPPAVVREVYGYLNIGDLTDEEVLALPYMLVMFGSIGRIHYFLGDEGVDVGMASATRDAQVSNWMSHMQQLSQHRAMQAIFREADQRRDYHLSYLDRVRPFFETASTPDRP